MNLEIIFYNKLLFLLSISDNPSLFISLVDSLLPIYRHVIIIIYIPLHTIVLTRLIITANLILNNADNFIDKINNHRIIMEYNIEINIPMPHGAYFNWSRYNTHKRKFKSKSGINKIIIITSFSVL